MMPVHHEKVIKVSSYFFPFDYGLILIIWSFPLTRKMFGADLKQNA